MADGRALLRARQFSWEQSVAKTLALYRAIGEGGRTGAVTPDSRSALLP